MNLTDLVFVWRVFCRVKCSPILFFFRLNDYSMNKNFQWKNRNQNALETLKEKPLTFLHSSRHSNVHLINFMPIKQREMNSTDFADGDKTLSNFRKQNSNNIEKPVARRPSISSIQKHFPLSIVGQSLIPSREKTAWRKLRANITESFYNRIQEFQRDRQDNCSKSTTNRIMMSPRIRQNQTFSSVRNDSLILSDSIGNLCLLIRNLLQNDRFDEEKTTSLQRNVINQLGILLTYLALMEKAKVSSSFVDRSTSIDFDVFQEEKLRFVTVETQTDFEENCFSIESAQNFINSIHSRSDSSSFVLDQSKSISGENECGFSLNVHLEMLRNICLIFSDVEITRKSSTVTRSFRFIFNESISSIVIR